MTQQEALNLLMMGENVFLTGQAGSGKTYLLNLYVDFLKKNKVGVAVTASTGIAATHLNGFTIHSWSGIGIKNYLTDYDLSKIALNDNSRTRIQSAKVLIIDEISMFHSYRLDMVNEICKYIRQNEAPFGGLQVILCGDFFQLPPIEEKELPKGSFAFKSDSWNELDLKICYLDEQHRQLDDSFLKVLNQIRSQEVDEYTFEKLSNRMHREIENNYQPTKLYTHNANVDEINNSELGRIDKPLKTYLMKGSGRKELIDVLKKGCLAPEELLIKEDALVMFIKNNPAKGYVNGTLGKVVGFSEEGYPRVETYSGKVITASPVPWLLEEDDMVLAEISQVPLRLAWAITIHKSQGMSLDAAEIDLSRSFAYGMGYVALSRVRSLEGIKLLGINPKALMIDNDIAEMDILLRRSSNASASFLSSLGDKKLKDQQKAFFKRIVPEKAENKNPENKIKDLFKKFFN